MAHKTLVNGTAYEISGGKTLVGGTAYEIGKGKTLVGGTAYEIAFGTPIGELEVGSSVFMNVDGVSTEFLVVHQGLPDATLYDDSCDGTWLLMKDLYSNNKWNAGNNNYTNSVIHNYLNGTFLDLLDSDIQSAIKQVKIPYQNGTGSGGSVSSGSSGLSTKIFLLSGLEVGSTANGTPADGACLSYFSGTSETNSKRIGYYDGTADEWWLRSPSTYNTTYVTTVNPYGVINQVPCNYSKRARPALILSSDTKIY